MQIPAPGPSAPGWPGLAFVNSCRCDRQWLSPAPWYRRPLFRFRRPDYLPLLSRSDCGRQQLFLPALSDPLPRACQGTGITEHLRLKVLLAGDILPITATAFEIALGSPEWDTSLVRDAYSLSPQVAYNLRLY